MLNVRYGLNLSDVDKVWFEQQKQAIVEDEKVRVVALNNDRDQFRVVLDQYAENAIVDRHEANGQLFDGFFEQPDFRATFMEYLETSYDDIRDAAGLTSHPRQASVPVCTQVSLR